MSSQSPALLFEQDLSPQAEQGAGLYLLQERLKQRYIPYITISWIKKTVILCYALSLLC